MSATRKNRDLTRARERWTTSAYYNGRHWARTDPIYGELGARLACWRDLVITVDEREALGSLLPATWSAWWFRGFRDATEAIQGGGDPENLPPDAPRRPQEATGRRLAPTTTPKPAQTPVATPRKATHE